MPRVSNSQTCLTPFRHSRGQLTIPRVVQLSLVVTAPSYSCLRLFPPITLRTNHRAWLQTRTNQRSQLWPRPRVLVCRVAPCFKGSGVGSAAVLAGTWGSSGVGSWVDGVAKVGKEHPSAFWCLSPIVLAGLPCALASTVAEGGAISDSRAADFLFSCDASHPDTLRYPKATWQCLPGHDEPGVGDGNCKPLINSDDRKRLEMSN